MANLLGCSRGSFPFKYLGLQVGANMNLIRNWQPIVEIFQNRLATWKARSLSFGGRISLLKSVLNSLPTYYFSLFKAHVGVIKTLEKIRREFLWSNNDNSSRMKWVAWNKFLTPKEKGGLGFGSLRIFNLALLAKWWWRYKVDNLGLWRNIIYLIHNGSRLSSFIPVRSSITSPWKQIANLDADFRNFGFSLHQLYQAHPGNNTEVRFWLDCWATDSALCELFPRLFQLERVKHVGIKDRLSFLDNRMVFSFAWRRQPVQGSLLADLNSLIELLVSYEFGQDKDMWKWKLNSSGTFSVKDLRNKAEALHFPDLQTSYDWNGWVPIKVHFFAWRILNNGIPTTTALATRGLNSLDLLCPLCRESDETPIHLLGTCRIASVVWEFVARWCRLPTIYFMEQADLVTLPRSLRGSKSWTKVIHLIFLTTIWAIWKHRNAVVFERKQPLVDSIIGEIKALGYLWLRSRSKFTGLTWSNWSGFNFDSF